MHCFICLALILYFVYVLHGAIFSSLCVQHHRASVLTFCHAAGHTPDYLFCHLLLMPFPNSWLLPCNNLWTARWLSCIASSTALFTRIQAAVAFPIHGFCLALLWTACRLSCIAFSTACLTNLQAAAAFPIQGLCLALLWTACWPSCIAFSTACPSIVFNTLWCFCLSLHAGPAAEQNC